MAVGLAQACAYFGLHLICVVDAKTTQQHLNMLTAYGAQIDVVREPDPASGEFLIARLNRVKTLLGRIQDSFNPNQYANIHNAAAQLQTMREIHEAVAGPIDYLFCATSTCGTIRGCSDYIARNGLATRIIAVDAIGSVIFGGNSRKRLIPGHGASVRPVLCDGVPIDKVAYVSDLDCVIGCRRLVQSEGILAGGSSGGVIRAIEHLADSIPAGAVCAAILADRGERYLDTVYSDSWVREHFGDISYLWKAATDGDNRKSSAAGR
jgi:cysteine synthase A